MNQMRERAAVSENPESQLCGCKVGRLVDTWTLRTVHEDLVTRWQARRVSLRNAAEELNRLALSTALTVETDIAPLDGEVANLYRLLTDDSVSEGMRVQTRNRLERSGLDVESLLDTFVSYQSVNRHLHGCLEIDQDPEGTFTHSEARDRIYQLQSRLETVTAGTLDQLERAGSIDIDDPDVYVNIQVTCRGCDRQYSVGELLEHGRCDCL